MAILVLCITLQIIGIKWGLTTSNYFHFASFHPDESENIKAIATLNPQKLDFKIDNPIITRGTFQIYLTAAWLKAVSVFGLIKVSPSFGYYKQNPAELVRLYLAGRSLSVLFGILTIILLFFIAKSVYNNYKIGLLASFFLAIAPVHIVWSHYIGTDIVLTFEICLIILLSHYITSKNKYYLITGLISGLTIATKYSSLPIIVIPVIAHFVSDQRKILSKNLFIYIISIPIGFFIGNPYSLIEPNNFITTIKLSLNININILKTPGGYDCFETLPGWIYYFTTAPKYALGIPFALLSLCGLIYSILKREKSDILILSFIFLLWLELGFSPWRLVRWFVPFVPLLCLLSARFAFSIKKYKVLTTVIVSIISLYTFLYSYSYVKMMSEKDVRDSSSEWIEQNIPEGKKIAVSNMYFWNPSIAMTLYWYKETEPFYKGIKRYKILQINSIKKLNTEKPDYVILSDYEYFPILKLKHKFPNEYILPFLNKVMNSGEYILIKKFEKYPNIFGIKMIGGFYPHDWRYTCPTILIYKKAK